MNRRWTYATLAATLALLLSACGLLNAALPTIDDPLGLDDATVEMTNDASTASALAPQQTTSSFTGSVSGSVSDLDDPPAEPRSLRTELGFSEIVLSGPLEVQQSEFPETITVEAIGLELSVDDGSDAVSLDFGGTGLAVAFEREAECSVGVGIECSYSPTAATIEGLAILIDGGVFDELFTVLTNGTSPNAAEGELSIAFSPGVPDAVSTAEAMIQTTEGTITVF